MYELIIFDCDGTLVDSEIIVAEIIPKVWSRYGVHYSRTEFIEKFVGKGHRSKEVLELRKRLPADINEIIGLELLKAFKDNLQLVSGMRSLLQKIKAPICVASNSSLEHIQACLKITKIDGFFEKRLYSAYQIEHPKPAPDLFLAAAKSFNISPSKCLVIEDSISGVQAAKAAKMQVAAFTAAEHFTPALLMKLKAQMPNFLCRNTQELEEIIL